MNRFGVPYYWWGESPHWFDVAEFPTCETVKCAATWDPLESKPSSPLSRMGDYAMTLDEVAAALGVSRERVRQIEAKALRKLRHPDRTKELEQFRSGWEPVRRARQPGATLAPPAAAPPALPPVVAPAVEPPWVDMSFLRRVREAIRRVHAVSPDAIIFTDEDGDYAANATRFPWGMAEAVWNVIAQAHALPAHESEDALFDDALAVVRRTSKRSVAA